jgi:hypothetical protein
MSDIVFLAILAAFFGLAVLFVRACDWLIGPAEALPDSDADAADAEELAAA